MGSSGAFSHWLRGTCNRQTHTDFERTLLPQDSNTLSQGFFCSSLLPDISNKSAKYLYCSLQRPGPPRQPLLPKFKSKCHICCLQNTTNVALTPWCKICPVFFSSPRRRCATRSQRHLHHVELPWYPKAGVLGGTGLFRTKPTKPAISTQNTAFAGPCHHDIFCRSQKRKEAPWWLACPHRLPMVYHTTTGRMECLSRYGL